MDVVCLCVCVSEEGGGVCGCCVCVCVSEEAGGV